MGGEVSIRFCHQCGIKVNPKDRFCRNCGTELVKSREVKREEFFTEIGGVSYSFTNLRTYNLFIQSQSFISKRDFRNALKLLLEALDIEPENPSLLTMLGAAYLLNNNEEQSIDYFERVLTLDSNQINALETLLEIYVVDGEPEKAQIYFDKLKALGTAYINILVKRGDNLFRNQKAHPAVEVWKRALIFKPGDPEIIARVNNVAEQDFMDKLIKKFDNYEQAIVFYKRKSEENPDDDFARRMVLWAERRSLGLDY